MENEKKLIINYQFSIFHYPLSIYCAAISLLFIKELVEACHGLDAPTVHVERHVLVG